MAALLNLVDVLGGERTVGKKSSEPFRMIERVRAGLPYKALESLAGELELSREELSRVFSIPERTLVRRKRSRHLNAEESDRVLRVARVFSRAIGTLERREAAVRWLKAPNLALGRITPLSLLDTDLGAREVERILGRIDHGVLS
jgi:putative toxin-antitoxin system antitoxin component (TIGR02293 family)